MKSRYALAALLAPAVALAAFSGLLPTQAQTKTTTLTPATIDHLIRVEWNKEHIVPAPPVDDARFLRRIYLDITGTIPPPEAVTAFLADKSPDKRARAVDALLESPRYADHWTNYWYNVLMGRQVRGQVIDPSAFRRWLHAQFEKNTPWNKFVYDLITATGQNSAGGTYAKAYGLMRADKADKMEAMTTEGATANSSDQAANVNGAVNWLLKFAQAPADLSGQTSKIFLGVQIQCAQCHDHKTEKWKQEDFRRFTACFMQVRPVPVDVGKVRGIRRVELQDVNRPFLGGKRLRMTRNEYANAAPAALDGTDFSNSPNRRQALAAWMTAPQNPWFAKAIVNRIWAHFLGRGFVEPIDDFRESNPPILPGLLQRLSEDFVAHNYDLKHLIRTVCATQVYQLSSAPARKADSGNLYWARYRLKPMGPEELVDSLVQATNLQPVLEKVAGSNLEGLKTLINRQFSFLFDVDEEFEQKEFEGTIPQALLLLNGNMVNRGVTPIPGTALAEVLAMPGGDAQKIEALYLRTLSRKPTAKELTHWVAFVNAPREVVESPGTQQPGPLRARLRQRMGMLAQMGKKGMRRGGGPDPFARIDNRFQLAAQTPKLQAYEDLFWALLNSSEFLFNH